MTHLWARLFSWQSSTRVWFLCTPLHTRPEADHQCWLEARIWSGGWWRWRGPGQLAGSELVPELWSVQWCGSLLRECSQLGSGSLQNIFPIVEPLQDTRVDHDHESCSFCLCLLSQSHNVCATMLLLHSELLWLQEKYIIIIIVVRSRGQRYLPKQLRLTDLWSQDHSLTITWSSKVGANSTAMWPDLKYCPPMLTAWHSYRPSSERWTSSMYKVDCCHRLSPSV